MSVQFEWKARATYILVVLVKWGPAHHWFIIIVAVLLQDGLRSCKSSVRKVSILASSEFRIFVSSV